jgi:uncharacterized protein YdeI (YjbR/CyaY-like superfamily)
MVTFTPRSRRAWRSWLEKHHASRAEIWVVFYKRHTGRPTLSYDDSVEEAVCFGWIDGIKRSIDEQRYTHRFSPRKPGSRWSATNRRRADKMIRAGLMTDAGRSAIARAKRSGTWQPPKAEPDLSMAPDFAARLKRNRKAAEFFDSLAPTYRAHYTGWINSAKRPQTRQRRIGEAIELLAGGKKLGMR